MSLVPNKVRLKKYNAVAGPEFWRRPLTITFWARFAAGLWHTAPNQAFLELSPISIHFWDSGNNSHIHRASQYNRVESWTHKTMKIPTTVSWFLVFLLILWSPHHSKQNLPQKQLSTRTSSDSTKKNVSHCSQRHFHSLPEKGYLTACDGWARLTAWQGTCTLFLRRVSRNTVMKDPRFRPT